MNSMAQRVRHLVTLALIGILCFQVPVQSFAQVGQSAMSQPQGVGNGVVNRGLGALGSLNDTGPGFFYYGVNGAGRGLGYFGSYMTLGGFIPYAQDDLGGFWSADLRTHLSTNGGFFSNVGVVRKQLTDNGSLLGFGLYWDYDGDMNQYSNTGDAPYGQFGHMYQQVGFSGEILTDRGAIRSNGYMPVGTTAYNVGAPGDPFTQHYILCAYGLDAALGGADLEVGAWIPKLEAFGGMISVGGYTFGNANEWSRGTETGERMVPFFGGVYTRFDITVANNWDINLQYNNDPFFDSTGFARLTYRMGGSRRRNVPDQLEQPMMRNEHIVRGHQTPLVCGNRVTGQPWKVIHVDNTASAGGNGTAQAPFTNLADAQTAAQQEWDIVYVHEGNSRVGPTNFFYSDPFAFQADNQFLVGSGGQLTIEVGSRCGTFNPASGAYLFTVPAQSTRNPLLSNPGGTSIDTNGQGGVTIANIEVTGSGDALKVNGNLAGTAQPWGTTANLYNTAISQAGGSSVRLSNFSSSNSPDAQRGVTIEGASGGIEFTDTSIANMTRTGMLIQNNTSTADTLYDPSRRGAVGVNNVATWVTFDGKITSTVGGAGGIISPLIYIQNNTGNGSYDLAVGNAPAGSVIPNEVSDSEGDGIIVQANAGGVAGAGAKIDIGNLSLFNTVNHGVYVFNDSSDLNIRSDGNSGIVRTIDGAGILVSNAGGGAPDIDYFGTITNDPPAGGTPGYILQATDITAPTSPNATEAVITLSGPGATPFTGTGDGILITRVDAQDSADKRGLGPDAVGISVTGASISASGQGAIQIEGNPVAAAIGTYKFEDISILDATSHGILLADLDRTTTFNNLTLNLTNPFAHGISATAAGTVKVTGDTNITTTSPTMSAIHIYAATSGAFTTPEFDVLNVTSSNTSTLATPWKGVSNLPPFGAISMFGATAGQINIRSNFNVIGNTNNIGLQANIDQYNTPVPVIVAGAVPPP